MRDKIFKIVSSYIDTDYTYALTRVKYAPNLSVDDFEPWSQDTIEDLVDDITGKITFPNEAIKKLDKALEYLEETAKVSHQGFSVYPNEHDQALRHVRSAKRILLEGLESEEE